MEDDLVLLLTCLLPSPAWCRSELHVFAQTCFISTRWCVPTLLQRSRPLPVLCSSSQSQKILNSDSTFFRFLRPSSNLYHLWRARCLLHLSVCELRSRETQQTLIASCLAAASLYGSPFRLATCSHVWPLASNSDRDCSPFIMLTRLKGLLSIIVIFQQLWKNT